VAAPASVHADLDPLIAQQFGKLVAGDLRALISIEDAGIAEPSKGFAQRLDCAIVHFQDLTRRTPYAQKIREVGPEPFAMREQPMRPPVLHDVIQISRSGILHPYPHPN
jgi:hypothetical protein